MEFQDDKSLVTINKLLNNAYDNKKKGQLYDVEEAKKFCSSYERDYIIRILTIVIKEKGYLKEVFKEEPTKFIVEGYEITKKGIEYLLTDSTMKKLSKR